MATRTVSNAGGKWSETSAWVEGAVPTAEDDVIDTVTSGELVLSATGACRSIILEHCIFKHEAFSLEVGTSTLNASKIALKFTSGMTYNRTSTTTSTIKFKGTATEEQTIDFGNKTASKLIFNGNEAKWKFLTGLTLSGICQHERGLINLNGLTYSWLEFHAEGVNTKTFNAENATITIAAGSSTVWKVENTTLKMAGSVLKFTDTGNSAHSIVLGGGTYGTIEFTGGGTAKITIGEGANNIIAKLVVGRPKTLLWGKEKTQTIETLEATGSEASRITFESTEAGKAFILKKTSGNVVSDWLKLKDSKAEGGATFFAGSHSENISGNEGWLFENPSVPVVETKTQSGVTASRAVLNASINPKSQATTYKFQYGKTEALGTETESESAGSGSIAVEKEKTIEGLESNTKYFYRITATNAIGTSNGSILNFTTEKLPPSVITEAASAVESTSAVLNGAINPNSKSTTYWFEYGTSEALGIKVGEASAGSGSIEVTKTKSLTGLSSGTKYYFRIKAENADGSTSGSILNFTSLSGGDILKDKEKKILNKPNDILSIPTDILKRPDDILREE